jgi:DNA mismatch repair protein MutL
MPIRVLPPEVATRIAAGEVVERPASVIKELIENAIDAGASEIRLQIEAGGRRLMRVMDNGQGIPTDEVELAFARHSTSKLASVDDLEHLHTLGFRGEALASIASVARVSLITRADDDAVGTRLRVEGGQVTSREPSGRPSGTDVTVRDLFFNVPARLKFLRTERTERRHIDNLVTRYAMAYPQLHFELVHDGRLTFQSNGSGDLQEVLASVYGARNASHMIPVVPGRPADRGEHTVQVEGYVSTPALHRSNRNEITLFVNGRWVTDQRLTFAVTQAYHTFLMTGRYPIAVLKISLGSEDVDVNVHPAKTQVRFRDGDAVFRAVQRSVRRALLDQAPVAEASIGSASDSDLTLEPEERSDWPGGWPSPDQLVRRARLRSLGNSPPRQADASADAQFRFELPRKRVPGGDVPRIPSTAQTAQSAAPLDTENTSPAGNTSHPKAQLPLLRVVGQLGLTYIVAEGPEGMFLIDQHSAHERILYEKMMAEAAQARIASQALLEPMPVELTPEGASLVEEGLEALSALGFEIEPFGTHTVLVRTLPAILAGENVQEILDEIVADLQAGDEPLANEMEARIVRRVCKQAAIKAGQTLSRQEMDELIRQLETCASPHTCPHGRPTMIHLSAVQLAQEFGRLG